MDKELFELALAAAERITEKNRSIGTETELGVHLTLKYYLQPDLSMHEIRREGAICDAVIEGGVIEIQTAAFKNLKPKLDKLLPLGTFTVVYPIINSKLIAWTDSETGEITERRSPKKAGMYSVFRELCAISGHVKHPNFRLKLIMMNVRELRIRFPERIISRGRHSRPKDHIKVGRTPTELIDERDISSIEEYRSFIPDGLPEGFFTSDFAKCAKIKRSEASAALRFMFDVGLVERVGRNKNGYIYTLKKQLST